MARHWDWKEFLVLRGSWNCCWSWTREGKQLPIFHALTGCDIMSSFSGHGKKSAWAVWTAYPDLTTSLLKVSAIPVDVFHSIERFVILIYDHTSTDSARKRLVCQEMQCSVNPTNEGSFGATYQEGTVPRKPRVGVDSGTKSWVAFFNHMGLDKGWR